MGNNVSIQGMVLYFFEVVKYTMVAWLVLRVCLTDYVQI